MLSSSTSAQYRMPSWLTYPSTDCTRCSSGSSADRDCRYRAMISAVRRRVASSKTGVSGDCSAATGSHSTSPGTYPPPTASGCPSGVVIGRHLP